MTAEVFRAFLKLGLTSFGGPIAHIGYLRQEFVVRRQWLGDEQFAHLLAVCQFLPGPASSQLSFAIGLHRSGGLGALAAFVAFTLPSAVLLFAFAALLPHLDPQVGATLLRVLQWVAVIIVGTGLHGMVRQLTPDVSRAGVALCVGGLVLAIGDAWMQLLAIALGGLLGWWFCRDVCTPKTVPFAVRYGQRTAWVFLALFVLGLVAALSVATDQSPTLVHMSAAFYKAGALVFGGGHVVLPLLEHAVVDTGWLSANTFLAGYGAAQAVPGPMFSLAAFLGAEIPLSVQPGVAAIVAVLAIFAPGFLLLLAALPLWSSIAAHPKAAAIMAGVNAAVVGLLAAAWVNPVLVHAIRTPADIAVVAVGLLWMARYRVSPLWIVLSCLIVASILPI